MKTKELINTLRKAAEREDSNIALKMLLTYAAERLEEQAETLAHFVEGYE